MGNSKIKAFLHSLVLFLVTFLVGIIIMELGLRFVASAAGNPQAIHLLEGDADGPCSIIPNLHLEAVIDGETIVIETNDMGMRWRHVERTKRPGVQRIAFVGDSFTFGEWSTTAETSFVGIVDSHLNSLGFEILNFGVPGDGPMELEERLATDILSFDPDYVVLNIFNGNDLSDSLLGADKTNCETGSVRHDLVRSKIPPRFLETPIETLKRKLFDESRLYQALSIAKGRLTGGIRFAESGDRDLHQAGLTVNDRFLAPSFWSRREYPFIATAAKDEMIATLSRIHDLLTTNDIDLVLTAIPYWAQVYTEAMTGEDYDLALPQRHISGFARERNIPLYDLLPDFRRHVGDCGLVTYVAADPHFNTTGHRLAGELIARFLLGVLNLDEDALPAFECSRAQPHGSTH
jgi:hypothetical protein